MPKHFYALIGLAAGHAGPAVWISYLVWGLRSPFTVVNVAPPVKPSRGEPRGILKRMAELAIAK